MPDHEQPEQRKVTRGQTPKQAGEKRSLDRRVWVAVAVAALLIVGALVAISVISAGGDEKGGGATVPAGTALPGTEEVEELFAGIPQDGRVLGNADAPVTVEIYSDPQCPACAAFGGQVLPDLVERYVRPGGVRLVYRGVPIIGPDSQVGLAGTFSAGLQDRLWELSELTYVNQGEENSGWLDEEFIRAAAGSFPEVDVERLLREMDSQQVEEQLAGDIAEAQRIGLEGTPTLQVGRTGEELSEPILGADLERLAELIEPLLQ